MPRDLRAAVRLWPQWVAAVWVHVLSIIVGLVAGWTSPYLAQLTSPDSPLPITKEEGSWIASLVPLGRLFGAIGGSICMEYLGSKMSLWLTCLPLAISWVCIIMADSATWLYISRLLSGSSMGMFFCCFPLYIGEISAATIRGALIGLVINGMPLGTLIGNIMGPNMSMMWFGVSSLIINICYMIAFPFLPSTPHYHVRKEQTEKACKALRFYHRKSDVSDELEQIQMFVQAARASTFLERLKTMKERKNRRAFTIIFVLLVSMQLSGLNSIIFYIEIIVRKARVTCVSPSVAVIIANTLG